MIELRPIAATDAPAIAAAVDESRDALRRWMVWYRDDYDVQAARDWIEDSISHASAGTGIQFAISDGEHDLVGVVGFEGMKSQSGRAMIGYWLATRAVGRGIGRRAIELALVWARAQPGLRAVWAVVADANLASRRVLEIHQFRLVGPRGTDERGDLVLLYELELHPGFVRTSTSMTVEIRREQEDVLSEYASIPIAFEVREVIDVAALDLKHVSLPIRAVTPSIKDYDALPHNDPASWSTRRHISDWVFLVAYADSQAIAGAVLITEARDVVALGGRDDNALLWDLRVAPDWRRRGLGRALLTAAEETAREAGARAVDVETQDTNVPACRLYASCGFTLTDIQAHGYGHATDEAKLLWTKTLL